MVVGVSVDRYKGYNYIVVDRLGKHAEPYVGVHKGPIRVARISLMTGEVNFYEDSPKEVVNDKATLEAWIGKNMQRAKQFWNKAHPEIPT